MAPNQRRRLPSNPTLAGAILSLPPIFQLRAFGNDYFRASWEHSFIKDKNKASDPDVAVIYLEIFSQDPNCPPTWAPHSKGSVAEIRRELLECCESDVAAFENLELI